MIVRPRPSLFTILFALRGSILPKVAPKVIAITALACLVVGLEQRHAEWFPVTAGIGPFTLVGLALSIFLSFRNGACYDRWWEARRAWGTLIVEMRALARLIPALLPEDRHADLRRRILRRTVGFAQALHARLRNLDEAGAAEPWLPPHESLSLTDRPSAADAALTGLTHDLASALHTGAFGEVTFATLEHKIASLAAIQATCERIQGTPLPFAYTLLLYRTAWLYCLLLPFGLAGSLGWSTPIVAALVAYAFFGLDALGDELEEPFGTDANDLPLDALLHAATAPVLDALGEARREAPRAERFTLR